jgi:hypothetical protein
MPPASEAGWSVVRSKRCNELLSCGGVTDLDEHGQGCTAYEVEVSDTGRLRFGLDHAEGQGGDILVLGRWHPCPALGKGRRTRERSRASLPPPSLPSPDWRDGFGAPVGRNASNRRLTCAGLLLLPRPWGRLATEVRLRPRRAENGASSPVLPVTLDGRSWWC